MKRKTSFLTGLQSEFKQAKHSFSNVLKKQKLREKATIEVNKKLSKKGIQKWAKEWNRKPPRWTSVYYHNEPIKLKLMQGLYRKMGFATRVRKGSGKSKRYYMDIYGWNSWCADTGRIKTLPKKSELNKLKKVC